MLQWDSSVAKWTYRYEDPSDAEGARESSDQEEDEDSDDDSYLRHRRRSARMRDVQKKRRKASICVEKRGLLD